MVFQAFFMHRLLEGNFKAYCQLLSPGPEYSACPFQMPFFHLQSSRFWHLHARPGRELVLTSSKSVRSFGHLRDVIAYVSLDAPLWDFLVQLGGP